MAVERGEAGARTGVEVADGGFFAKAGWLIRGDGIIMPAAGAVEITLESGRTRTRVLAEKADGVFSRVTVGDDDVVAVIVVGLRSVDHGTCGTPEIGRCGASKTLKKHAVALNERRVAAWGVRRAGGEVGQWRAVDVEAQAVAKAGFPGYCCST